MKDNRSTWKNLALVSQLGLTIVVAVLGMTLLGVWLDKKLGTGFIAAVFAFLGLFGGMAGAYSLLRKAMNDGGPKEEKFDLMEGFRDSEEEHGKEE